MRYIAAHIFIGGRLQWDVMTGMGAHEPPGVTITFPLYRQVSQMRARRQIIEVLKQNAVGWLQPVTADSWVFRSGVFKDAFPDFSDEGWLEGDVLIQMEYEVLRENHFGKQEDRTCCRFILTPEVVEEQMPKKVFLSHKTGTDKPMVRRFRDALQSVGVVGWLDEDAMPAGTDLERGLLLGFKESCAAVFFITPRYRDDGYLATEVGYAVAEKRRKGSRFSIVTLVFADSDGSTGAVPDLLRPYVWKTPANELEGFAELMRALPIAVGCAAWRA